MRNPISDPIPTNVLTLLLIPLTRQIWQHRSGGIQRQSPGENDAQMLYARSL